jgi:hypothetical protein
MKKNKKKAIIKSIIFLLVLNFIIAAVSFLLESINGFDNSGLTPGSSTLPHYSDNIISDLLSFLPVFLLRTLGQTIIIFLMLFHLLVKDYEKKFDQIDELEKNKEEKDNKNE